MSFQEQADIETASAEYAARFAGAAGEFFIKRQKDTVLNILRDLPKARILDVGGGHAQLAEPLVQGGFEVTVTGSDDSCRQRLLQRISPLDFEYVTCDSLQLPFEDRSFDVVMAFGLFSQVRMWRELLKELSRVAGECIIFDYSDRRSVNILYDRLFDLKKRLEGNTRPFHLYTRTEILQQLQANGFGKPVVIPQYVFPMVMHRKLNSHRFSRLLEGASKVLGLSGCFGSPIIVRSNRVN